MYNGQVYVRQNELSSLMEAAKCLRVKGLAIPDEEPKNSGGSNSQQRIKQPSPPSKRKRTDEPRTTDISLSRPDMIRGSSLACNFFQSQRTDGLPPYEPQNICSDDNVFRPLKQIKLEEENKGLDTTMKSNSCDVRRYEPENVGNATDAHDVIVKEEIIPHSSYVDEDNVGPLQQINLEKSEIDLDVSMKSNSSEGVKEGASTEQEYQPCHKCGGKMGECLRKNRKGAYVLMLRCRKRGCQTHRSMNK
ncbi:unnamed protein product [Meganyctiphanes norvegica]|uniref:Uncharacterized protein n=1 Tax=Meganyctiphanes norvegica TaxID=48144 RepID=A0AAV2QHC3_MEGNR